MMLIMEEFARLELFRLERGAPAFFFFTPYCSYQLLCHEENDALCTGKAVKGAVLLKNPGVARTLRLGLSAYLVRSAYFIRTEAKACVSSIKATGWKLATNIERILCSRLTINMAAHGLA